MGLSYKQIDYGTKLEKLRKKNNYKQICPHCGNDKFFVDTLGIEHCSKCYYPIDIFIGGVDE